MACYYAGQVIFFFGLAKAFRLRAVTLQANSMQIVGEKDKFKFAAKKPEAAEDCFSLATIITNPRHFPSKTLNSMTQTNGLLSQEKPRLELISFQSFRNFAKFGKPFPNPSASASDSEIS
jgi:hypothetical protein